MDQDNYLRKEALPLNSRGRSTSTLIKHGIAHHVDPGAESGWVEWERTGPLRCRRVRCHQSVMWCDPSLQCLDFRTRDFFLERFRSSDVYLSRPPVHISLIAWCDQLHSFHLRSSPTGSVRLHPRGPKMRLKHASAGRYIVTRLSAATQTRRIFAPEMRRGGRCADAPNDRSLFHRVWVAASLYRGHRFRACAAAFAINVAAACSTRALADGGWASVPLSMASFLARDRP
jgi:hypothetical protein